MSLRALTSTSAVALLGCIVSCPPAATSQTAVPDQNGRLIFKANARIVVLDVVVTDHEGKPVPGLHKEDFLISDQGKLQQITSFEEHSAGQTAPLAIPNLPTNVFTNIPRIKPLGSVTVLLFDSLNTSIGAQSYLRDQMLNFLKTIKPGQRVAICALTTKLHFVLGFTDDPAVLVAALGDSKGGANPRSSPLLLTTGESDAEQRAAGQIYNNFAANPSVVNLLSLQSVQQFQAEQATFRVDERVHLTLEALDELSRYLAGIPGRKNVVWFSGGFPVSLFPNPDLQDEFVAERKYDRMLQQTDALLSGAQVAIYPVDAGGNTTDSLYSAEPGFQGKINMQEAVNQAATHPGQPRSESQGEQALDMEDASLRSDSVQRNANHTAMEVIAHDTGGEAFYNNNGLQNAVDRVMDHGARFYTITYAPADAAKDVTKDGRYHQISAKLTRSASGDYKLDYRRGYFAPGAATTVAPHAGEDPLHPFMGPGMPVSTQMLFAMRVKTGPVPSLLDAGPEMQQHSAPGASDKWGRVTMETHTDVVQGFENSTLERAGDNPKLKGKLTRYSVDFVIGASSVTLASAANGVHRGSIESTLVAYDREGRPVNWLARQLELNLTPAQYASATQNGVSFRLAIDLPKEAVTLRSGVYDYSSSLSGTLEIPISSVLSGQAPGLKSR